MKTAVRIVAHHYRVDSGEVLETQTISDKPVDKPITINELGYLHKEQIEMTKSIQDFKIKHQAVLINRNGTCPKCGKRPYTHGIRKSKFHAALTDHEVFIQRRSCKCGWGGPYTVEGIYGSSIHPDLLEKQAIQGVENSYRKASSNLNAESKKVRPINSVEGIRKCVAKVSKMIEKQKLVKPNEVKKNESAKKLVAVSDGGHVKSNNNNSRSFEAMITTVYRPENIEVIDKNHNRITKKTCVASALSDGQLSIKKLTLNACIKEGMHSKVTELTYLTDGASNCWSITKGLEKYCKSMIKILDWFHITKRFTIILNKSLKEEFKDRINKVKWHLWHGNSKNSLSRLEALISDINDEKVKSLLTELYEYINRNKKYLTNYQKRKAKELPFTSTLAETSVNSLINERQKNNKKMQWSREGSHNILQIKTSLFSKTWNEDWQQAQQKIYKKAA